MPGGGVPQSMQQSQQHQGQWAMNQHAYTTPQAFAAASSGAYGPGPTLPQAQFTASAPESGANQQWAMGQGFQTPAPLTPYGYVPLSDDSARQAALLNFQRQRMQLAAQWSSIQQQQEQLLGSGGSARYSPFANGPGGARVSPPQSPSWHMQQVVPQGPSFSWQQQSQTTGIPSGQSGSFSSSASPQPTQFTQGQQFAMIQASPQTVEQQMRATFGPGSVPASASRRSSPAPPPVNEAAAANQSGGEFPVEWPPLEGEGSNNEEDSDSVASSAADEQMARLERRMDAMQANHAREVAKHASEVAALRMQNDFLQMSMAGKGGDDKSGSESSKSGKLKDFSSKQYESLSTDLSKTSFECFVPSFQNAIAAKSIDAARVLSMPESEWRARGADKNFQELDGWLANNIRPCLDMKSAKVEAFILRLNSVPFAGASGWVMWREMEKAAAFKDHEEIESGIAAFKKTPYITSEMCGDNAPKLELAAAKTEAAGRHSSPGVD